MSERRERSGSAWEAAAGPAISFALIFATLWAAKPKATPAPPPPPPPPPRGVAQRPPQPMHGAGFRYGSGAVCLPWPSGGHVVMVRGQTLNFCAPCRGCVVAGVQHPVDPDQDPMGDVTTESPLAGMLRITTNKLGRAALGVMCVDATGRVVGPYSLTVLVTESMPSA